MTERPVVAAFSNLIEVAVREFCREKGRDRVNPLTIGLSLSAMLQPPLFEEFVLKAALMRGNVAVDERGAYLKAKAGRPVPPRMPGKPERMTGPAFEAAIEMTDVVALAIEEGKIASHVEAGDALAVSFAMLLATFDVPDSAVSQFGAALTDNARSILAAFRSDVKARR